MNQITVYAKQARSRDGRPYEIYVGSLRNLVTGKMDPVQIKFRRAAGHPAGCPCNIKFDVRDANLQHKTYTDRDGNEREALVLWIGKWTPGEPYEDHSLDDYLK